MLDARTSSHPRPPALVVGRVPPWALRWLALPLAVLLALHAFVFATFHVVGASMRDTLEPGDFLLVSKLAVTESEVEGWLGAPSDPVRRGELVVFRLPQNPDLVLVKRVIGVAGDRVRIEHGRLSVSEPPFRPGNDSAPSAGMHFEEGESSGAFDGVVPPASVFVVGDNRTEGASSDSREWGYLPARLIVGRVVVRLLPLGRAGPLPAGHRGGGAPHAGAA